MLIQKRRRDEGLQIGPDITIRVLGIEGNSVVLGISAPHELTISRVQVRLEADPNSATLSDGTGAMHIPQEHGSSD